MSPMPPRGDGGSMRTRPLLLAVGIAATLAATSGLPAQAGPAAPRRYVATYVPGTWVGCGARVATAWYIGAAVNASPVPCIGSVDFVPVSHIERGVRLRIDDVSGTPIGAELRFWDQEGNPVRVRDRRGETRRAVPFCGQVASAVPTGAARLSVRFHGDACGASGGTATAGKVVATFTRDRPTPQR